MQEKKLDTFFSARIKKKERKLISVLLHHFSMPQKM